jgi:CheY-like chemotaxis protein
LSAVLANAKATVVAVDSAHEALRRFTQSRPDLLLSDIGLGKVSGYELLAEIRKQEEARRQKPVPAVALTAFVDERSRQLAMQNGFQTVLKKPVTPAELLTTLKQLSAAS